MTSKFFNDKVLFFFWDLFKVQFTKYNKRVTQFWLPFFLADETYVGLCVWTIK